MSNTSQERATNKSAQIYAAVAVPVPLRQVFDFIMTGPLTGSAETYVGRRVLVPFGQRKLVGVITQIKHHSDVDTRRLKPIIEVLDAQSVFDPTLWKTLAWLSNYYLAPIGEVMEMALPTWLRKANLAELSSSRQWVLSEAGRSKPIEDLERAPVQLAIIKKLLTDSVLTADDFAQISKSWRNAVSALIEKGWLLEEIVEPRLSARTASEKSSLVLNRQQQLAADSLVADLDSRSFKVSLLFGVTGSGKTEVYFAAIESALEANKQVLVLVPEIGLTPQLLDRFQSRFSEPTVVMHSNLSEKERHAAWWHAQAGHAKIIIGTRSAVLTSIPNLGLIVVDEEHDTSFKQQDGVRYHARDTAIYRAKLANIPIVLGSATPALESFQNALTQRYKLLELSQRAIDSVLPEVELIDLEQQEANEGLTPALRKQLQVTHSAERQSMLFINRRGFAPALYCVECKTTLRCHRCDAHLTVHRTHNRVRCHHCGYDSRIPNSCTNCKSTDLKDLGEGTQRVESSIEALLPKAKVVRIDRDSTRNKGQLESLLNSVKTGEVDIMVGTQLLTKGHDFDQLSLVGVLEADQGLYSSDFRSTEHLFQQLVQVAGRAGRRGERGRVLIQTRFKQHPLFEFVAAQDYRGFAESELQVREQIQLPPFSFLAMLRAESTHDARAMQFLRAAKTKVPNIDGVRVMDAVPAPMAKRAGRYRTQLLLQARERKALHHCLSALLEAIEADDGLRKLANGVRWSLDIDPQDLY